MSSASTGDIVLVSARRTDKENPYLSTRSRSIPDIPPEGSRQKVTEVDEKISRCKAFPHNIMSSANTGGIFLVSARRTDKENPHLSTRGHSNPAFTDILPEGSRQNITEVDEKISRSQKKRNNKETSSGNEGAILTGLRYKVDDSPPWITTFFLGCQHYLMLLSSNLATPTIFATIMCAKGDKHVTSILMGNMLFACGLGTVLQSFLGSRLPIVQCPAFAFVVPMLAMVELEEWKCPEIPSANATLLGNSSVSNDYWTTRLNLLAGSGMVAAAFEILIGASGLISILLRFIGPLTVAPTIMMIGFGVTKLGFDMAGKQWGISLATIALIIILSECIPEFSVRLPCGKGRKINIIAHKMFSVIMSVMIMWFLCYILTITDTFPTDKSSYGYDARTDLRTDILKETPWFTFPYPGKFGAPTFSKAMFVGMIAGVITSVIESIGDYYTCARIAGALPPPSSTVNRGILLEGIDCILSLLVGGGFGVTSCSQNIGVISLTKVGSRNVVITAGVLMMIGGCFSKLSALVVSVPDPIVGAAFIVLFAVLTAVGASNLQYADLNSPRNMVVFGSSLFVGLALPLWLTDNQSLFNNVDSGGKQIIQALLGNNIFISCFTALLLDNVIPGTDEERGIISWRSHMQDNDSEDNQTRLLTLKTYDFPFGMKYIRKLKWARYIPFCPTFEEANSNVCKCCRKGDKAFNIEDDSPENSKISVSAT